jgi:hypothetical protein
MAATRSQAANRHPQRHHISVNMAYSIPGPTITESVMDQHAAMYLLEDLGPQSYAPAPFQPFHWAVSENQHNLPGSTFVGHLSMLQPTSTNAIDTSVPPMETVPSSMGYTQSNTDPRLPNAIPPSHRPDRRYTMLSQAEMGLPLMHASNSRMSWEYTGMRAEH